MPLWWTRSYYHKCDRRTRQRASRWDDSLGNCICLAWVNAFKCAIDGDFQSFIERHMYFSLFYSVPGSSTSAHRWPVTCGRSPVQLIQPARPSPEMEAQAEGLRNLFWTIFTTLEFNHCFTNEVLHSVCSVHVSAMFTPTHILFSQICFMQCLASLLCYGCINWKLCVCVCVCVCVHERRASNVVYPMLVMLVNFNFVVRSWRNVNVRVEHPRVCRWARGRPMAISTCCVLFVCSWLIQSQPQPQRTNEYAFWVGSVGTLLRCELPVYFILRVDHVFDARETFCLDALLRERHFLVGIIAFIYSPHRLYGGMISAPEYLKRSSCLDCSFMLMSLRHL